MPGYHIHDPDIDGAEAHLERLEQLAQRILEGEDTAEGTAIAVVITGDETIKALNGRFRGKPEPTDVLSFPDGEDAAFPAEPGDGPGSLGEIFISLPTATRQAEAGGVTLEAELDHLLVHGLLHLCGYDHETGPADETKMLGREEHYLGDLSALHGIWEH